MKVNISNIPHVPCKLVSKFCKTYIKEYKSVKKPMGYSNCRYLLRFENMKLHAIPVISLCTLLRNELKTVQRFQREENTF